MKKIIYLVLAAIFATLLFTGCGIKGEDEIFDGTATERMTAALKEYRELLVSSEHGWVLDYYTMTNQSQGATALICKFNENGTVEIASIDATNVPEQQVETSLFDMIGTQGPVLSLNDYNPVLHYYCEPSSAYINGRQQGDYEFVLQAGATADEIILKGKKWGNIMTLKRMESADWNGYFDAVKENTSINNGLMYEISFTVNGTTYPVSLSSRTLKVTLSDDLPAETIAYALTADGMRFYKTITVNGVNMRNFTYDKGTKVFTCTDPGANATIAVAEKEAYNEFLNTARYLLVPKYCSESLGQRLNAAVASVNATGWVISSMYLGLSPISGYAWTAFTAPFTASGSNYNCVIRMYMGPVSGTNDKVEFTSWTTTGSLNSGNFATAARFNPIFNDIVAKSPYTVTDGWPAVQLVSDSDPTFAIGLLY